jgi:hypothetical protein
MPTQNDVITKFFINKFNRTKLPICFNNQKELDAKNFYVKVCVYQRRIFLRIVSNRLWLRLRKKNSIKMMIQSNFELNYLNLKSKV